VSQPHVLARFCFEVGGLAVAVRAATDADAFDSEAAYQPFVTARQPDVSLTAHFGALPGGELGEIQYDSQGVWRLYKHTSGWAVAMQSAAMPSGPYQVAYFCEDFLGGEIYTSRRHFAAHVCPFPLRYPLAEVLMINLLARQRGLLVHAFAVSDSGRGLLFAGVSTAGKSTSARLWRDRPGVTLLSDDRVVLRPGTDGRFWIYGTPWHGDAGVASPHGVPLDEIFILEHASCNKAVRLSPLQAVQKLLVRAFPPLWDAAGMDFTLSLLAKVCSTRPCYTLGFVPDARVVDYVRSIR